LGERKKEGPGGVASESCERTVATSSPLCRGVRCSRFTAQHQGTAARDRILVTQPGNSPAQGESVRVREIFGTAHATTTGDAIAVQTIAPMRIANGAADRLAATVRGIGVEAQPVARVTLTVRGAIDRRCLRGFGHTHNCDTFPIAAVDSTRTVEYLHKIRCIMHAGVLRCMRATSPTKKISQTHLASHVWRIVRDAYGEVLGLG
jgi:hypothetical protein